MDYKELIEKLRNKGGCHCECLEAATAIETLLSERDAAQKEAQDLQIQWDMYGGDEGVTAAFQKAEERDAAVEDLRGYCRVCTHANISKDGFPCIKCKHIGFYGTQEIDGWAWRGPQKGENNDQTKL